MCTDPVTKFKGSEKRKKAQADESPALYRLLADFALGRDYKNYSI